jgi:GNAT superfamily N-acetyltransferase
MITIRTIQSSDIAAICAHRRTMFEEMGWDKAALDPAMESFAAWVAGRLAQDAYFGFMAEAGGAIIGGIGLMLLDWPPHPFHPASSQRGYILNVFVEPAWRRHGLATQLMQRADEEFRRRGINYIVLHASKQGRPVYERLGWLASSEMAKPL